MARGLCSLEARRVGANHTPPDREEGYHRRVHVAIRFRPMRGVRVNNDSSVFTPGQSCRLSGHSDRVSSRPARIRARSCGPCAAPHDCGVTGELYSSSPVGVLDRNEGVLAGAVVSVFPGFARDSVHTDTGTWRTTLGEFLPDCAPFHGVSSGSLSGAGPTGEQTSIWTDRSWSRTRSRTGRGERPVVPGAFT